MMKQSTTTFRTSSPKPATTTTRTTLKPALEGDERSPRSTPPKAAPSPSPKIEPVPHKNHETNKPQKKTTPAVDTSATKLAIFDRNVKAMREEENEKILPAENRRRNPVRLKLKNQYPQRQPPLIQIFRKNMVPSLRLYLAWRMGLILQGGTICLQLCKAVAYKEPE
jgi:hypothetical protein